ncbi:extensin-like domain-containing protein [Polymorphobacter sp.]|uniref:extensin-like domain-containing protein n=1 Tax=Polymorphobacter sp. TaxID=1909290 RepID=UPI003F6E4E64
MRSLLVFTALIGLLLLGACQARRWAEENPQKLPWTPLSLNHPVGPFTARKIGALADDTPQCLTLLDAANVAHTPLPPLERDGCGYDNAVTLRPGGAIAPRLQPAGVGVSCPVAAGLAVWEREILRPAAQRHFQSEVAAIDHYGSYSCRNIGGGSNRSEHATANAIDIAGIRLKNGTRITVASHWTDNGPRGAFLREIRDGACQVFGTTLSPDYNAAHADHFHFDQARRAGSFCR